MTGGGVSDDLVAFLVGSSILSTVFTHVYVGIAIYSQNRPADVPYELLPIIVGVMYGLGTMVLNRIIGIGWSRNWALLVGAVVGLVLSIMGRFGADLPKSLFSFQSHREWLVHVIAIVIYAIIFRFWVYYLLSLSCRTMGWHT